MSFLKASNKCLKKSRSGKWSFVWPQDKKALSHVSMELSENATRLLKELLEVDKKFLQNESLWLFEFKSRGNEKAVIKMFDIMAGEKEQTLYKLLRSEVEKG